MNEDSRIESNNKISLIGAMLNHACVWSSRQVVNKYQFLFVTKVSREELASSFAQNSSSLYMEKEYIRMIIPQIQIFPT